MNFKHNDTGDGLMIFGVRPVIEAISEGKQIEKIFLQRNLSNPQITELKLLLRQNNIHPAIVPVEKLNRLTRGNHQGVVCYLSAVVYSDLETVIPGLFEKDGFPVVIMLDRITDVRNFGAICRTAECFGVGAVIIPEKGGAPANGDAMKASAGAMNRITLCRAFNLKQTIDYLKESGFSIIGCSEKGKGLLFDGDLSGPLCIIMGSEEDGVSPEYLKRCDSILRIPMIGKTASLNVSVAAGMVLYEIARQRK